MNILKLAAQLSLDGTRFKAGLKEAEVAASKSAGNLANTFKGQIGAVFGVAAFTAAAKNTIDFASKMNDLAEATNTTTDRMQELNYAATQNGADVEDMAKAMKALSAARSEALKNPGGEQAAGFMQFGIGPQELAGITDVGDLLFRVSDAVKGVNIDANALPVILGLIGGKSMGILPAMAAGLREAGAEAKKLNLILNPGTVSSLDKIGDTLDRDLIALKGPLAEILLLIIQTVSTIGTAIKQAPALGKLIGGGLLEALALFEVGYAKMMKNLTKNGFDQSITKSFSEKEASGQTHLDAARKMQEEARARLTQLSNENADLFDPDVKGKKKKNFDAPEAKDNGAAAAAALRSESDEADKLSRIYENIQDIQIRSRRFNMTDMELLADQTRELERQKQYRAEMAEQGVGAVGLAEMDQKIAQAELDMMRKGGKPESFSRPATASLTSSGQWSGRSFVNSGDSGVVKAAKELLKPAQETAKAVTEMNAKTKNGKSIKAQL